MKLHISFFDLFSRKKRWFLSKRRGCKTRSQTTAFCSYEESYTLREDFLKAIHTDFELKNNQLQYPLQSTISCLDTQKSPQYCATLERKRTDEHGDDVIRPWRISFFFLGGGGRGNKLVPQIKTYTDLEFLSIIRDYWELRIVERNASIITW